MAKLNARDMVKICDNLEELKSETKKIGMDEEAKTELLFLENLAGKIGRIIGKEGDAILIRFYNGPAYVLPAQSLTLVEQDPWKCDDEKKIQSKEFMDSYIPKNIIWPMQESLEWNDYMDQQIKKFFPHTQIMRFLKDRYNDGKYIVYKCTQLLDEKKPQILNYLKLLKVNTNEYEQNNQKYYSLFHELKIITFVDDLQSYYGETVGEESTIRLRDQLIEDIEDYKMHWFRLHLYCTIFLGSMILFHELFHYLTFLKEKDGNTPKEAGLEAGYYGEFISFGGFITYNKNKIDGRIENIFFWKAKKELNPRLIPFRSGNDDSIDMRLVDSKILDTSFCIEYYHNYNGNSNFWDKFGDYLYDPVPYELINSAKPKGTHSKFFSGQKCIKKS